MTFAAVAKVRGAAVIIDDKIGRESTIDDLLDQLSQASIPTVELKGLPPLDSLIHWRQFALIVMDWALTDAGEDSMIELPAGVTVPSTLSAEIVGRNIEFIAALLNETSLPIFIATNEDPDPVNSALETGLSNNYPTYVERVHVFRKSELKFNLIETIGNWVASRPALKVLEAWRHAYSDAELDVFHQFSQAQHDWVVSVQRAARADLSSAQVMLRDLIANNVLNRIGPLNVELNAASDEELKDAASLRRVLHYSAVVPNASLHANEVSTGDMFVDENAQEPYQFIQILLTPECDLTPRDKTWRFTTLTATRSPRVRKTTKNRAEGAWKPGSKELSFTVNLLTEDCAEYDVAMNEWSSEMVTPVNSDDGFTIWPGHKRIGRLLPPYSTFLQQNFALVAIRKGMPRLPADLYAAAEAQTDPSDSGSGSAPPATSVDVEQPSSTRGQARRLFRRLRSRDS